MPEPTAKGAIRADHLIPSTSGRGFKWMPETVTPIGTTVEVYESSAAEEPKVWLGITRGRDDLRAHLTVDEARRVGEQLIWLADHHYQVEDAPDE